MNTSTRLPFRERIPEQRRASRLLEALWSSMESTLRAGGRDRWLGIREDEDLVGLDSLLLDS
jgi:hypothetical protein